MSTYICIYTPRIYRLYACAHTDTCTCLHADTYLHKQGCLHTHACMHSDMHTYKTYLYGLYIHIYMRTLITCVHTMCWTNRCRKICLLKTHKQPDVDSWETPMQQGKLYLEVHGCLIQWFLVGGRSGLKHVSRSSPCVYRRRFPTPHKVRRSTGYKGFLTVSWIQHLLQ